MFRVVGLHKIAEDIQNFNVVAPRAKSRFLDMIGTDSLEILRLNTPKDTGTLADSWVLEKSTNEIVIYNTQPDLISFITFGTIRHVPNPFISVVNRQVDNMVQKYLQTALAENHRYFKNLPLAKNRRFQQVGRTSAGFKGGVSFAGRTTLVRVGTGRRQLKRRLSLRRRRGKSVNPARKDVRF